MTRAFALRLLQRYPPAWRERYEAEVSALIDDSGVRVRDLAELIRGLITERVRELISSDERPQRTAALLGLVSPVFSVMFVGLSVLAGLTAREFLGPWSESAQESAALAMAVFVAVFGTVVFKTRRRPWGVADPYVVQPPYPAWVGMVMLPGLFLMFATAFASGIAQVSFHWLNWFFYASIAADLCSCLWPTRRLLQAFLELQGAEQQLKNSETWANSCREWIAKGVPSPLNDAERQVAEWTGKLAAARERVHAVGYRARFRRDDVHGAAA